MEERLQVLYQKYEKEASQYKEQAECGRGCSFCCSIAGKIDIVTLEGVRILEKMQSLPESEAKAINHGLEQERSLRRKGKKSACPFLDREGACSVYEIRPFSCRQLYSLRKCDQGGPLVHKQAVTLAQNFVKEIQLLDNTGYSGHHSFILELLQNATFTTTYLGGGFDPGSIKEFGKKHGIFINRFAK